MDDKALIILGSIGAIVLAALLAFIFSRLGKVLDNQGTQGTDIALVKDQMMRLTQRVDSLHEWRNHKQVEEISELKNIIAEFNDSKGRRASDRYISDGGLGEK